MNPTKKDIVKRRKHTGFNDLLSYLIQLDDSTILHKDGSISRHFQYTAPDLDSSTDEELDYHAKTWENSFSFLGNGFMVEANVLSHLFTDYNNSHEFPDIVSALIDDERRLQYQGGNYFKTKYYLSITFRSNSLIESKLRKFAISTEDEFSKTLESFDKQVSAYIGYLKRSLKTIRPLKQNELTSYIYQCITGSNQNLSKPHIGCFLDCYFSRDFIGGFNPKIDDNYIKILTLDDLPDYSHPGILDLLNYFPIEYRWSNRFICLDRQTSKAYIKRYERNWSSKAIGLLGVIRESLGMPIKLDEHAQNMSDQLKSTSLNYGFYNSLIILTHKDLKTLNEITSYIKTKIEQLDFKVRIETVNAVESYLGSIPSHGDYNLRKMLIDTHYISHAFPTNSIYQGESQSPCSMPGYKNQPSLLLTSTKGSRPFMLNLHIGDVGHTAVLGPTGSGKTTLNALLISAHRKYKNSRIIILDKDYSNRTTIKALSGEYIDLAEGDYQLSPLARLNTPFQKDKAVEWLIDCCTIQNIKMTPDRQKLIRESIQRLSKDKQSYRNLNHLSIQDKSLRTAISTYNTGSFGKLLSGTQTNFKNDIIGVNMDPLIRTEYSIPIIKAVLNELEELFKLKYPTLLILEEAWLYLRHPIFKEKLTDWFKTLRKLNVSVIFISQDINDIVNSNSASTIQSSCMTRIYLPNKSAQEKNIKSGYEAFGLNNRQIQIIQESTPKQDYYYQSPLGNRLFTLDIEYLTKAFLCITDKKDIQKFNDIFKSKNWILDWLSYKNLTDWYNFAKENYFK